MDKAKKILLLAVNSITTQRHLDQEIREIELKLRQAPDRDRFVLFQRWAVRPQDIQRAMLDHTPQIVHFCGGGSAIAPPTAERGPSRDLSAEPEIEEGLAFQDQSGQVAFGSAAALGRLFELFADQVECVIFNGCYSEIQTDAIAQHIPYVIGTSAAVGGEGAIAFAAAFYQALGAGDSIEAAYQQSCDRFVAIGIPQDLAPVLKKCATPNIS